MNGSTEHSHCHALKEAWHRVKGIKSAFWGGAFLALLVTVGGIAISWCLFMVAAALVMPEFLTLWKQNHEFFLNPHFVVPMGLVITLMGYHLLQALLEMFVFLPMRIGFQLIPLRRAADKNVSALYVFKFFQWRYIWRFAFLIFFISIMVGVPMGLGAFLICIGHFIYHLSMPLLILSDVVGALLVLLAIYLSVCYLFSSQLIIDRKMNPWCAMQTSRAAISKRWFCVFGTLVWLFALLFVSTALLLVGLIWTMPYTFNVIAILYRDMLGIEGKDPVTLCEKQNI